MLHGGEADGPLLPSRVLCDRSHPHMAVAGVVLQLIDTVDREHICRTDPAEVDLDQEVRPTGEDGHVLARGKVLENIVDMPGDMDAHAGIITSGFGTWSLG